VVYSNFKTSGIYLVMKLLDYYSISYKYIDGELSEETREEAVKGYNDGKISVLLITRAGGEGLDLKNTHSLYLMEPHWNSLDQIRGRVVRYMSHTTLPKDQQKV
jgi:SNF2 family DNA or RNA helicase